MNLREKLLDRGSLHLQSFLYLLGIYKHNNYRDECTPDFSCCHKAEKTTFIERFVTLRNSYHLMNKINKAFKERPWEFDNKVWTNIKYVQSCKNNDNETNEEITAKYCPTHIDYRLNQLEDRECINLTSCKKCWNLELSKKVMEGEE